MRAFFPLSTSVRMRTDRRLVREHSMDSITNHYAAKRPHPSSSLNLAQLATSNLSPKKILATSTSTSSNLDRPVKRIKSSKSSANLVSALREEGWTSTSSNLKKSTSSGKGVMGSSSIESKVSMSLSEKVRERQVEREREREERKRKFELAKARRKSGATPVKARGKGKSNLATEGESISLHFDLFQTGGTDRGSGIAHSETSDSFDFFRR